MTPKKRVIICSVMAITSGLLGAYIGGKFSMSERTQQCKTYQWGMDRLCQMVVTPNAAIQGSFTGLWVGSILGAFMAGTLTRTGQILPEEESRER